MYSTIRATFASNCSRGMLDANTGRGRAGVGGWRGTGPASSSRTVAIVVAAAAYAVARSLPSSSSA